MAVSAVNLKPVAEVIRKMAAPGAELIIIADDDRKPDGTNSGKSAAMAAAKAVGGRVALLDMGRKADAWDLWKEQGADAVRKMIDAIAQDGSTTTTAPIARQVVTINIGDFLAREFPPRTNLLGAWLPSQGLTMVYAYRGIGKTHFALGRGLCGSVWRRVSRLARTSSSWGHVH